MKLGLTWLVLGVLGILGYVYVQSIPSNILLRPLPISPGSSSVGWDTIVVHQPWYGGIIWLVIGVAFFICGIILVVKWSKKRTRIIATTLLGVPK
jgi:cytochrome c biogenesis factor